MDAESGSPANPAKWLLTAARRPIRKDQLSAIMSGWQLVVSPTAIIPTHIAIFYMDLQAVVQPGRKTTVWAGHPDLTFNWENKAVNVA